MTDAKHHLKILEARLRFISDRLSRSGSSANGLRQRHPIAEQRDLAERAALKWALGELRPLHDPQETAHAGSG